MSWFRPVATPPTVASFYPRKDNVRVENDGIECEEIEFRSTNQHSSNVEAWKAGALTRRIEQLISPMGKPLVTLPLWKHLGRWNGNECSAEDKNSTSQSSSAHLLTGNVLPNSIPHPNIHFHSNCHYSPNQTCFEQFFYPRPVQHLRQQSVNRDYTGIASTYNDKENSSSQSIDRRNATDQRRIPMIDKTSYLQHPFNDSSHITKPSHLHNREGHVITTNYSIEANTHFSYREQSRVPNPKSPKIHPIYSQAQMTRNGTLVTARQHQPTAQSLENHSWDQVGQNIAMYKSSTQQIQNQSDKHHKPKEKRKAKRPLPEHDAMITPPIHPRGNHVDHNSNKNPMKIKKKKHGETRSDAPITNAHPSDTKVHKINRRSRESTLVDAEKPRHLRGYETNSITPIHWKTFQTLEEMYQLRNAGANMDCLRQFLEIVKQKSVVSWTILFYDRYCTTPFLPLTKKYCTDKGPPCTMWNCTCEKQTRAVQSSKPVLGVLFCLPPSSMDGKEALSNFFLPLGPTAEMDDGNNATQHLGNIDEGYERMINWPLLPIRCDASIKQRWDAFRSVLMNKFITCVTYNAVMGLMPYHYHCLNDTSSVYNSLDWNIPKIWDLRVASWLLAPNADEIELEFDRKLQGFSHLINPSDIPHAPDTASDHLCGFVLAIKHLQFLNRVYPLINDLLSRNGLLSAFEDIESPLLSILSAMECHGIGFLCEPFVDMQSQVESRLQQLIQDARLLTKDPNFLLSSSQQVSHFIYDIMKIPDPETAQGNMTLTNHRHRSTSEETLKMMQAEGVAANGTGYPIIDIILEFRSLNKMLTAYIRPFPRLSCHVMNDSRLLAPGRRSKKDKKESSIARIHPMWVQTAVRTGRLSCRKPNMQQIPSGSVCGFHPRSAFVPTAPDLSLFSFDYSQNEVRILAHMSGDTALISLFQSSDSIDIYKLMSSAITGKPLETVGDYERGVSKQVTLAILYGMGLNQVAVKLGVDRRSAQSFFNAFYNRFRGVKKWMEETKQYALQHKYVLTISGRKRYLDDIDSEDNERRAQAERQAVNTVIQGSAADLMKLAMLKIAARLSDWNKEAINDDSTTKPPRILLQLHDELLFEMGANDADARRLKSAVIRCVEECGEEFHLSVPLKLKCHVGPSWSTLQEF